MDDIVFIIGLAWRDDARCRVRLISREPVDFRCCMAGGVNEDNFFTGALVDTEKNTGIALFIDECVFTSFEVALPDRVRSGIFITMDPIDALAIGAPFKGAIAIVDQDALILSVSFTRIW